jgi:hypothetical protein
MYNDPWMLINININIPAEVAFDHGNNTIHILIPHQQIHKNKLKKILKIWCVTCISTSWPLSRHLIVPRLTRAHQVSYPMGHGGSFPGGKAAEVCRQPLTSI